MTLILIHNDILTRRSALIEWINKLLNTEYSQLSQLMNNPDIHMLQSPSNVSIKIEQVKGFQNEMVYKPFQSTVQLGVIFHSDMLTHEAQNALLKTLEEQGESTHYILLVANEKNLLPTILSRGKKYYPVAENTIDRQAHGETKEFSSGLVETFINIESLVEEQKEDKARIEGILSSLELEYSNKLGSAIEENDNKKIENNLRKIESILVAKKRLQRNVNKRLLLENLALQLNEE